MTRLGIIIVIATLFVACSLGRVTTNSVVVSQPPTGYSSEEVASYYYLQGVRMLNIYENKEQALIALNKALEANPTHSPSYYEIANMNLLNEPEKALKYSSIANQLDTTNVWYKMQLGRLFILNQKYDSALTIYNDLARINPKNPENHRYLAALHQQIGQPFTAISILDSAEVKFGIIEELASMKRQFLIETGLIDRAITETKILTNNFPFDETNYVILGELYAKSGKDSLAVDAFNQASAINPDNIDLLTATTEYYRQKNNIPSFLNTTKKLFVSDDLTLDTKIKLLSEITKNIQLYRDYFFGVNELITTLVIKYPKNFKVAEIYAAHLISSGNIEDALKVYKQTLTDSIKIEAFNSILEIEAYLNRVDSIMLYSNLAIKKFPKTPELYMRKAYALHSAKRYKDAEKTMRSALKYAKSDSLKSTIYTSIGDIIYTHDSINTKRYYPLYEKALRLYPDNIFALNNYSYYLSIEGKDLEKALKMIERVIELSPSNPTYIDTYGWVLYKMGQYEQAKKVMRQAVSLDTTASPELLLHYGDVLYELKEYFMATVYWKKALKKGYNKEEIEKRIKLTEGK